MELLQAYRRCLNCKYNCFLLGNELQIILEDCHIQRAFRRIDAI